MLGDKTVCDNYCYHMISPKSRNDNVPAGRSCGGGSARDILNVDISRVGCAPF